MCDASLAIMAFGAALKGYSAISQGNQAKADGKAQSRALEQEAAREKSAAMVRAEKIRKAGLAQEGEARVALAGSGVDVDAGTSVEINRNIIKNTEADALAEIAEGDNRAASTNARAQSIKSQSKSQARGSYLSAAGSAISGANSLYKGWKVASETKINTPQQIYPNYKV